MTAGRAGIIAVTSEVPTHEPGPFHGPGFCYFAGCGKRVGDNRNNDKEHVP